jgi:hypothetical protein
LLENLAVGVIDRSDATKQSSAYLWFWIASLSLSSGARSRDPLARNDDENPVLPT